MPIEILHILGTAQPEGVGIARIVATLASRLRPDYDVHAWFLGPRGPLVEELQAAGATARCVPWSRGVRDPMGAYRFWRSLQDHTFALVHQHVGARSVRRLIRLSSSHPRLVVHLHGIAASDSARDLSIAVRGADCVIATSRAVALRVPGAQPTVVHPGVECPADVDPRRVGPPRSDVVIGAACRLVLLKGIRDLIRAVGLLSSEFPELRLEIAGSGPQREDLAQEAARLGLICQVRFLSWQRDLSPLFRSWDIFAMPSLEEGFGLSALEAMAAGLPVVASAVGGLPELVDDSKTGYLVPAEDVAELARCLRLLILNPAQRVAMGAAGRERVRKHFSADRMVREIKLIYNSLLH